MLLFIFPDGGEYGFSALSPGLSPPVITSFFPGAWRTAISFIKL
jgi:hypothetical protein